MSIMSSSFPYNGPTVSEIRESRRRRGLLNGIGIGSVPEKYVTLEKEQEGGEKQGTVVDLHTIMEKTNRYSALDDIRSIAKAVYEDIPYCTYTGGSQALPGMMSRFADATVYTAVGDSSMVRFEEVCLAMQLVDGDGGDTLVYAKTSNALESLLAFCDPHAFLQYQAANEPFLGGVGNNNVPNIAANERLMYDNLVDAYVISPGLYGAMLSYAACFIGDGSEEEHVSVDKLVIGDVSKEQSDADHELVKAATTGGDLAGRVALARHFALVQQLYIKLPKLDHDTRESKPLSEGTCKEIETDTILATYYMRLLKQVWTIEGSLEDITQHVRDDQYTYVYEVVKSMHTSHWFLKTASSIVLFNMLFASTVGWEDVFVDRCSSRRRDGTKELELDKSAEREDTGRVLTIRTHRRVSLDIISGKGAARFDTMFTAVDSVNKKPSQASTQSMAFTMEGRDGSTFTPNNGASVGCPSGGKSKPKSRSSCCSMYNIVVWMTKGVALGVLSGLGTTVFIAVPIVLSQNGYDYESCFKAVANRQKTKANINMMSTGADPNTVRGGVQNMWARVTSNGQINLTQADALVAQACVPGLLWNLSWRTDDSVQPDPFNQTEFDTLSRNKTNYIKMVESAKETNYDAECYLMTFENNFTLAGVGTEIQMHCLLIKDDEYFLDAYSKLVVEFANLEYTRNQQTLKKMLTHWTSKAPILDFTTYRDETKVAFEDLTNTALGVADRLADYQKRYYTEDSRSMGHWWKLLLCVGALTAAHAIHRRGARSTNPVVDSPDSIKTGIDLLKRALGEVTKEIADINSRLDADLDNLELQAELQKMQDHQAITTERLKTMIIMSTVISQARPAQLVQLARASKPVQPAQSTNAPGSGGAEQNGARDAQSVHHVNPRRSTSPARKRLMD